MMGLILAQAEAGDVEAANTLAFLRALDLRGMNVMAPKSQRETEKKLEVWQILDMALAGQKERRKDYWRRNH